MLKRSRKDSADIGDESTNELMQKGVYKLEEKGKKRLKTKPLSTWRAVKAISILSVFLWWLPTIGQMIAGYVGGRKAPSPLKAALAAMVPVSIIFTIMYAYDHGILTVQIAALYDLPSSLASGLAATVPFTAPYITFVSHYIGALVDFLNATVAIWLNGFLVTIVFAYIGGLSAQFSRQRAELEKKFAATAPHSMRGASDVQYANPKRSAWYEPNDARFDDLEKMGGAVSAEDADSPSKKRRGARTKAKKGRAAKVRAESEEAEEQVAENVEDYRYPREVLNERLVARAMSHYEHPNKRGVKRKA